jgi:hypothetical protein
MYDTWEGKGIKGITEKGQKVWYNRRFLCPFVNHGHMVSSEMCGKATEIRDYAISW